MSDGGALAGQLALPADRHEAGRGLVRHRSAEDEAARLDAGDLVDLHPCPGLDQFVDRAAERARVAEQRGDVAAPDPRLSIAWTGADPLLHALLRLPPNHAPLPPTDPS